MNRKIRFRAWDDRDKKMRYDLTLGSNRCPSNIFHVWEVMQYTGLKDENSGPIYEGDIIMNLLGERFVVEWNDDTCKFQFSNGKDINDGDTYGDYRLIIGNIYENPELIPAYA